MKYLLAVLTLMLSVGIAAAPAQAQPQYPNGYYGQSGWHAVLSPHDQQQFDKYYSKWVDASRKHDQDDIQGNARHMQEIMARNNIPGNVPFDAIASNPVNVYPAYPAGAYPNQQYPPAAYPNGQYDPNAAYPPYGSYGQGRLTPQDQQKFDSEYAQWVDASRHNDRDDIDKHARNMQEIMARNNIPPNVPFAAIATNGYGAAPNAAYPNGAYPYAYGQQRLSPKDQNNFDKYYRHWLDARRKHDTDDMNNNAQKMRDIMARYNIPANVPFDQIATIGH